MGIKMKTRDHILEYISKKKCGKHLFYLDGYELEADRKSIVFGLGIDQIIDVEGEKFHFVKIGKRIELAVNKRYVGDKQPYYPLRKLSFFLYAIIAIVIVLFISIFFGTSDDVVDWCVPVLLYLMVAWFLFMEE